MPDTDPGEPLAQQTAAQVGNEGTRRARRDLNPSPGLKCLNPTCRALWRIHSPECSALGIELTEERAERGTAVSDPLLPLEEIPTTLLFWLLSGVGGGTRPSNLSMFTDFLRLTPTAQATTKGDNP